MPPAPKTLPIKVSNPTKVFWPEEGYTKLDLVTFYDDVFSSLRPYVNDRILTLERCPDGMGGACFYQKQRPESMPADTPTKRIANDRGSSRKATDYVVGGSRATQLALANLGCIPVHVTGSRAKTLDRQSGKFADAAKAGLLAKALLDELNLVSFPKTSGSRGLHIFVPIRLGPSADEVLRFAEEFVARLAAAYPKQLTVAHAIVDRGKRVYLVAFRNGSVQTVVTPTQFVESPMLLSRHRWHGRKLSQLLIPPVSTSVLLLALVLTRKTPGVTFLTADRL